MKNNMDMVYEYIWTHTCIFIFQVSETLPYNNSPNIRPVYFIQTVLLRKKDLLIFGSLKINMKKINMKS
jgi:hypothetical protein